MLKLLLGREKKLKITKKLQNTKSKNTVKTPVEEIYFLLCLAANSSLYFFMRLYMREKKLKIPKKITKHKIQKYCKDPVEDMYISIFKMPCGDSIQCISLYFTFFLYALRVLIFFYCFFYVHYECQF